ALTFAATSLAQSVASAPGAGDVVIAEPPVEEPPVEEPPVEEPPVEEPPAEEPPAVEPPAEPEVEPTQAPAPTVVQAQPTAVPAGPTARVLLDPGANLQLRQYPSSEALSLGLAPSGTVLEVNGREGAPIDLDGNEMMVENENGEMVEWVDPVELLEDEDDDLDPTETWLNVVYNTPDGGTITAWISAQYIELRDEDNLLMKLAELPTIPANRPGEAVNTSITPPSAREDRVTARVVNLDFGVNLNLRRTPETGGEVLARIPLDTVLDFVGLGESEDWAFVSFNAPEGGEVRGWVSTGFVTYEYNNRAITLEELAVRNLLEYLDEETVRGAITAGTVPQVAAPTVDPQINAYVAEVMVDADANLNLRRTASDQAEVVARIPGGTRLIIDGRTDDAEWLQTTFENQVGWVASAFVSLTFNGASVEVDEVPVVAVPEPTTEGEEEAQG
ncbi:MAG: SH3 domain-containing protein, partial [Phototrophicaceae bacterium]